MVGVGGFDEGFSAVGSAHPAGSAGCTTSQAVALNSAWLMLSEEFQVTPTGDQQRRHADGGEVGLERDDERAAAGHAHDGLHARIGSLDVRGVAPDLPGVAAGSSGESAEGAARVAQDACFGEVGAGSEPRGQFVQEPSKYPGRARPF